MILQDRSIVLDIDSHYRRFFFRSLDLIVTDFDGMFSGANLFYGDVSKWKTTSATTFEWMFSNTWLFNIDISDWETGSVTNLQGMFSRASSFNQDLSQWNLSSAEDLSYMFNQASSFNQDLCSWWETLPSDFSVVNVPDFQGTQCPSPLALFQYDFDKEYMCARCFDTAAPTSEPTTARPTRAPTTSMPTTAVPTTSFPTPFPTRAPIPEPPTARLRQLVIRADALNYDDKRVAISGNDVNTNQFYWDSNQAPADPPGVFTTFLSIEGAYVFEALNYNNPDGLTAGGNDGEITLSLDGIEFHRVDNSTYGDDPLYFFEFSIPLM